MLFAKPFRLVEQYAEREILRWTRIVSTVAALLAGFGISLPVEARDRPGAPNNMSSYECWGDRAAYIPNEQLKGPPAICTYANNTAKEKVRFIVRVVANGVEQNESWLNSHVVGWYTQTDGPFRRDVSSTYMFHRPFFTKSYHERQAFAIYKLDFDTVYCISLRTAYDNGVVSADWTSSPCVRTRKAT